MATLIEYDDSEWTDDEMRGILARSVVENGWDDPEMEIYDRYDEELRKRCPKHEAKLS